MTYLPFPTMRMYKGVSILFDYLLAFAVGRLIYRANGKDAFKGICAYSAMVLLPSIFINSAFWAQCDSIYCFFLVLWLTDLLEERYTRSFLWFALAFQFKLQTIFVLPFLLYFYIRSEKISILHFLIVPGMCILVSLLCGRGLFGSFEIYANQTGTWEQLTLNFPNIWYLVSDDYYLLKNAAVLLTIGILGLGLLILLHKKVEFHRDNVFKILIWSVWTCLMFLPSMHERYGYFLSILLVISAVENPKLTGYAALVEVLTLISYAWFLWYHAEAANVPKYLASFLYLGTYLSFCYRSFILKKPWISYATETNALKDPGMKVL